MALRRFEAVFLSQMPAASRSDIRTYTLEDRSSISSSE